MIEEESSGSAGAGETVKGYFELFSFASPGKPVIG